MKKLHSYSLVLSMLLLITGAMVHAQTYHLAENFGNTQGRFILPESLMGAWATFTCLAIQQDGKLVAGGYATTTATSTAPTGFICRLLPNGTIDTSFQDKGIVLLSWRRVYDILVTNDGNIYYCGDQTFSGGEVSALAGYLFPTLHDQSFTANYPASFRQIDLLPSGDIVCAGFYAPGGNQTAFLAAIKPSDWNLQTGFGGGDGRLDANDGTPSSWVDGKTAFYGMDIAPNGKIVAVGAHYSVGDNTADVFYSRWNPDGTPDNTFNTNYNIATWNYGNNEANCFAVQLDDMGYLCVAGFRNTATGVAGTAEWLGSNSNLGHTVQCHPGTPYSVYYDVEAHDGGMICGGVAGTDANQVQMIISRFISRNETDSAFSSDGGCTYFIPHTPGSITDVLHDMEVDGQQNIYVAGSAILNGKQRPVLQKLTNQSPSGIIAPKQETQALSIRPNPAGAQITIGNLKTVSVAIYNMLGVCCLRETIQPAQPIDISALPSGIYVARLGGKENKSARFIKK